MVSEKLSILNMRKLLLLAITLSLLAPRVNPSYAESARYIVKFKDSASLGDINGERNIGALAKSATLSNPSDPLIERVILNKIESLTLDNSLVAQLEPNDARELLARRDVLSIELDYPVYALFTPNDPGYSQQYSLSGDFGGRVSDAWDTTTGSRRAVVAVIDTGVDLGHDDLKRNLWVNSKEVRGNRKDDDGNGCVDDIYGCDLINGDGSPQDDNGHGTHVAGIVAARGNNGIGVAGVAWGSRVVSVKALDAQGSGFTSGIAKAIDYVTTLKANGAPIAAINLSLGGGSYSNVMYRAIERARNHDILVIAAAGNESNNNDSRPLYPASLDMDSVVSVAATDSAGNLASYSNFGASSVHIAAPGSDIWSTALRRLGYQYRTASGTSMASPFVAGVVALIAAANPGLSMIQVRSVLLNTAQSLANLQGYVITGGLVDARAAVNAARATEALPRVWGYVRRMSRGLAGVTLTIQSRDGANVARTVTTGSDGSYSFSQLPKGAYTLKVSKTRLKFSTVRINATSSRVIKRILTPRLGR